MKFKEGTSVEVLSKTEVPSGSWLCAEVVCGDGHNYTVKYNMSPCVSDEAIMERVSRNSIRPSPPSVELSENLAPGDVLEVFQNFSWKMATVCKVLDRNNFVVRLVGFSREFKVCRSNLRVRQSWQDGKWFVIGKNIGNWEEGKRWNYNQQLSSQVRKLDVKMNPRARDEHFAAKIRTESPIIPSRNLKRGSSLAYSEVEVPLKPAYKFRVIEKEGNRHRVLATNPSPFPEKVVNLGERHIYTAINTRTTQFSNLDVERENIYGAVGRSCEIRTKPNVEDNITCSVGSCSSISNDLFKSRSYFCQGPIDAECDVSDAESVCYGDSDERNCLPTQKECAEEIRRLELHAYRCTMEALHACGPLSWEQETLVTNLRLTLNISNDQHLMELRHLASTATSTPFR